MKKILLSTVASALLISTAANAQEKKDENYYVGLDGYFSKLGKEKSESSSIDIDNLFKNGGGLAGRFGYDFGQMRLEAEIGKHFHTARSYTINTLGPLSGTSGAAIAGKSNATHYMVNAIVDLESFDRGSKIEPFLGAGLGLANVKWSNMTPANSVTSYTNGSENVLAYQAFAGVRFPVAENVDISFKYRYMGTNKAGRTTNLASNFESSYDVHDFAVGLTYKFGGKSSDQNAKMPQPVAPAPEPEPAPMVVEKPAPVAAPVVEKPKPAPIVIDKGPHSVYFDFDSSQLNSAGANTVAKAAAEAKKESNISLEVAGHTDRSGANKYNDALALKRAETVKAALIREGIAASRISIESHGELDTAVNTADGVKEGQNRRVTILLK